MLFNFENIFKIMKMICIGNEELWWIKLRHDNRSWTCHAVSADIRALPTHRQVRFLYKIVLITVSNHRWHSKFCLRKIYDKLFT